MGEFSGISWTDHTFNAWIGCTEVSPECDNCYAKRLDMRFDGGIHWGRGAPRRPTVDSYWRQLDKWAEISRRFKRGERPTMKKNGIVVPVPAPVRGPNKNPLVFVNSLSDWADKERPVEPSRRLWAAIREFRDDLTFILLTKRTHLIEEALPDDWGGGYPNVWLMTTVGTPKSMARLYQLKRIPAAVLGISFEPLIAPLGLLPEDLLGIDWAIVGGESDDKWSPNARPMHPAWAEEVIQAAQHAGCAPFFKQQGAWAPVTKVLRGQEGRTIILVRDGQITPHVKADEFVPAGAVIMQKIGAHVAGDLLCGRRYQSFPHSERS